jgi:hypothetical protein
MRLRCFLLTLGTLFMVAAWTACGPTEDQRRAQHEREQKDQSSAAFKAGKVAHEVAKESEKVAAAAGRKLAEGARNAKEGWDQQARDDKKKAHDDH